MKSYLTILVWFVTFITITSLAAAADLNAVKSDAEKLKIADTFAKIDPNAVAATVNGVNITEGQVDEFIKPYLDKMASQAPPAFVEKNKKKLRRQGLDQMILERLLNEKVKENNISVTEEELTAKIKEIASQQQPPMSLDEFKTLVESSGDNFDNVKKQIQKNMCYQKLVDLQSAGKISATEDDAKKYYDENKKQFEKPEEIRASHILIKTDTADPNDKDKVKAQAKAKAEDLLKQLKNGADFAELAKANSACPSAQSGGDLDFFSRGRMVPPFEKAAFALKVGEMSDVVETDFGYHIIKVTDHRDARTIQFEEAKSSIMKTLTERKQNELVKQYIDSLKTNAKIVYPPDKTPNTGTIIQPLTQGSSDKAKTK